MRCWTTKDTPGLSPLDRKYGLAVFSQGWTTGIVALGVFSAILEKWRWSQPTSKENQRNWFSRKKKIFKIQELNSVCQWENDQDTITILMNPQQKLTNQEWSNPRIEKNWTETLALKISTSTMNIRTENQGFNTK